MTNRLVVEEGDGRGRNAAEEPTRRALSLVLQLHRLGHLTLDEFVAAGQLRNLYMMLAPPSEGVSSYGLAPGGSNPARKADNKARRLTGVEIKENGQIIRGPSRANRKTRWDFEDAIFAMAGVTTEEGQKVIDREAADLLLRAIVETENPPTQGMMGSARSILKSEKQLSAIGAAFIKEHLRRLAMHFGLVKGQEFR